MVEQHRGDQQQNKMILVKEHGDRQSREDREAAKRILMILEGTAGVIEQPQPCRGDNGGDARYKQRNDERLIFRGEQRDQIAGRGRQRDQAGPQRRMRIVRLAGHRLTPAH